jgi:23S rRNA pseudouridine1911/1915/1917 synthase
VVKAGTRLRAGDRVDVSLAPPREARAEPQAMELVVLHEDSDIIVIDKPAGLVVHPAPGHPDRTLVNALLARCPDLAGVGGELRPGIVHRLDKDTSGVMVASKNDAAHAGLAAQFAGKTLRREYLAVVAPPLAAREGSFATLYGRHPVHRKRFSSVVARGKRAVTHYRVEERFPGLADLVRCRLETGRTHQIRVHFADAGHPLIGDRTYGRRLAPPLADLAAALARQALHAAVLELVHPTSGELLSFATPPPADLEALLASLRAISAGAG